MKRASFLFLFAFLCGPIDPCRSQAPQDNPPQNGEDLRLPGGSADREREISGTGGGSVADFDSLIELIETTVVPETWESLGGPSGMFPYPQGVFVDASGTIRDCEIMVKDDAVDQLTAMLGGAKDSPTAHSGHWQNASPMRCVSLRRLCDGKIHFGASAPVSMDSLAGLSQIQYLFFDQDDIIIAGPVGGIESDQGWFRDSESGRTAIRLDFFITCLASSLAEQPFGCTIDPSQQGLQNAAKIAAAIKNDSIPIGKAAEAMIAALGMQRIEVFGTAGDTPIGYVMVEADRHMKQLAVGIHSMPRASRNYLDVIEQSIDEGPPQDLLLRLWFTAKPRMVRADSDRKLFELVGSPLQLSGQNERALASGQRGQLAQDPRTETFVDEFNRHWNQIRSKYPIYGALESIYQSASVAELIRRGEGSAKHRQLVAALSSIDTTANYLMPTPRQVQSIAVLHTFQRLRQKHHILVASGGVAVDTNRTLASAVDSYRTLDSIADPKQNQPKVVQRWWWDL